jgi:EmrB/QacA subfamily drug resistance transporter
VLLLTSVGVYVVTLDVSVLNVAFGTLLEEFGLERRTLLTWVFSGYNIGFAAALLTAGRAADRFGRRRVFLLGVATFAAGSALCAAAPSAGALVACRVVQSVGAALVMPAAVALVLPEFPLERRAMAIGVSGAVGGVAAGTGPTVGGLLVEHLGWRSVFLVNLPVCALALVVGARLLRESREPDAVGLPDVAGALLAMAGVGVLTLAVVQGEDWGWVSARVAACVVASAALLAWCVHRCRTHRAPVLDLALFRLRFFSASNTAALIFSMGFFAMFFTNVQFLQVQWDYSVVGSGLAMTPGPLLAAAWAAPAGRLAQRVGFAQVVLPGLALFAVGMAMLLTFAGPDPDYWRAWFPSIVVTGTGLGISFATIGSAANAYLPPNHFAMGSAFNATCRQVGAALGIAAATALRSTASTDGMAGFHRCWWFIVGAAAAAAAVMGLLYRPPSDADALAAAGLAPTGTALPTGR